MRAESLGEGLTGTARAFLLCLLSGVGEGDGLTFVEALDHDAHFK